MELNHFIPYLVCAQTCVWFLAFKYREEIRLTHWGAISLLSFLFVFIAPANEAIDQFLKHIETYNQNAGLFSVMSPYLFQYSRKLAQTYVDTSQIINTAQVFVYLGLYFSLQESYMRKKIANANILNLCVLSNPLVLYFFIFKIQYQVPLLVLVLIAFNLSHYLWRSIFSGLLTLFHPVGWLALAKSLLPKDTLLKNLLSSLPVILIISIAAIASPMRQGLFLMNMISQESLLSMRFGLFILILLFIVLMIIYSLVIRDYKFKNAHVEYLLVLLSALFFFPQNEYVLVFSLMMSLALLPRQNWIHALVISFLILGSKFTSLLPNLYLQIATLVLLLSLVFMSVIQYREHKKTYKPVDL